MFLIRWSTSIPTRWGNARKKRRGKEAEVERERQTLGKQPAQCKELILRIVVKLVSSPFWRFDNHLAEAFRAFPLVWAFLEISSSRRFYFPSIDGPRCRRKGAKIPVCSVHLKHVLGDISNLSSVLSSCPSSPQPVHRRDGCIPSGQIF
jgi:hypothetical protein